jgi:uncharacterized protein with PIN domain
MREAVFRFHGELNDFLPTERREYAFPHRFLLPASVKDMIEALGAPHTEVDIILVNDFPVDFGYLVQDGDGISVYPAPTSQHTPSAVPLRPQLQVFRFVLDTHLGRLARYLRMLGFDVLYRTRCDDEELAHTSAAQDRIVFTRDLGLLKRAEVIWGYFVRATEPRAQLVEVLRRFNLFHLAAPFQRCLRCNAVLQPISKESIRDRLPSQRLGLTTIFVSARPAIASTGPVPTKSTCNGSSSASSRVVEIAEFAALTIPE